VLHAVLLVVSAAVGPELSFGDAKTGPAAEGQFSPSIAAGDGGYLVVWHEHRVSGGDGDAFATRVDAAGAVLDPSGIDVAKGPGDQLPGGVAFNGANFFVAYLSGSWVYVTRVSPAGAVLDPAGIPIANVGAFGYEPRIAALGDDVLVAWPDVRNGPVPRIYAARVNKSGVVLDPGGFALAPTAMNQAKVDVASDGTNWLVAWQDERNGASDVFAARVSPAGAILDSGGFAVASGAGANQTSGCSRSIRKTFMRALADQARKRAAAGSSRAERPLAMAAQSANLGARAAAHWIPPSR
jgi:hypothetical protein